jgi:hypothetical protein
MLNADSKDPTSFSRDLSTRRQGLFLAAVAERALVNDALSCDTFCAEMFSTGAA